jgi:hypothetical protein
VHASQGGELGGVVAAEEVVQRHVVGEAPEGADQLDGDDLAVGQRGPGAAPPEPQAEGFHLIVDQAEYRQQEILRGHGGPPSGSAGWYR